MPITGPSSYLPTMDQFIAHWTAVNGTFAVGGSPPPGGFPTLILDGGRALSNLSSLRLSLSTQRTDVEIKLNNLEFARADAAIKRTLLQGRLGQLFANIRSFWAGTALAALVPDLPSATGAPQDFEKTLDDAVDIWSRANSNPAPAGVTLPLTLPTEPTIVNPAPAAYTQSTLVSDTAAMKTAFTAIKTAELALAGSRSSRNTIQDQVRPFLVDYRESVPAKLPPNHFLTDTIPRYSPLPGATPEPANATGSWDVPASKAFIDFTPSPSASVVRHELRYTPGPEYDAEDESIDSSIPVGSASHFETLSGLPTPGVSASYRVYAITTEGNERASATVTIMRPV